jgi:regulator of replication initiation timing
MVNNKDIVARLWEAYAQMRTGTREDLSDAADEIEALRLENIRLRLALRKIEEVIVEENKMPPYHRAVVKRHRDEWGSLHNAIDDALKALHD